MTSSSNHEPSPRRTRWRAWTVCGLALLATVGFSSPAPQAGRVQDPARAQDVPGGWVVEDGRPVMTALGHLAQRMNLDFAYEDAPIVFAEDMVDVTVVDLGDGKRSIVPRGVRLDIAGNLDRLVAGGDPLPGVQAILAADAALTGRAGRFRVTRAGDILQVVGIQTRDEAGEWVGVRPLLDVPITWPERVDDLDTFLERFCQVVTEASGVRVRPATVPRGRPPEVAIGAATNEPARDVLLRALHSLRNGHRLWTWRLYYSPGEKVYGLNIGSPATAGPPLAVPGVSALPDR